MILLIPGVLIVLTQQYTSSVCQEDTRDEYTADRKYYEINLGLTAIPSDIPPDAEEVHIQSNRVTI